MPYLVHSSERKPARWGEASDRELMAGIQRDEEGAFDEMMERKAGPLMGLGCRLVGDREEARDIVQLTFLRAWENRHRFNRRWSPNTWLYRIATNLAIDYIRARDHRRLKADPVRRHLYSVEQRDRDLPDLRDREVRSILEKLAGGLSERQRLVFLLREVEGLSSREVAKILGCRESTVRNHLFSARKLLRLELMRRYPEYGGAARRAAAEESR